MRLFGHNRRGLISFHDKDHLAGTGDLQAEVLAALDRAGVDLGGGSVRLLCMPRVLGFAFNPISVYFCHRPDGGVAARYAPTDKPESLEADIEKLLPK